MHGKTDLRFRKHLKNQLPILQTEGLLSQEQCRAIAGRYELENLAKESTGKLLAAIYAIGIFLVGIGVISFVAYHWEQMNKTVKVAMIFSAMLASHISGYYLWRISGKSPKLGHALVCLGTLIFGANIGLMAQIFHISSDQWNRMFLPWSIGAIILAYAVGSVPNAAIAVITSFIWFMGHLNWHSDFTSTWWYPVFVCVVFGGFAYLKQSRFIFAAALVCMAVALPICMGPGNNNDRSYEHYGVDHGEVFGVIIGMLLIGILFFSTGLFSSGYADYKVFVKPAFAIGCISALAALYMCSFRGFTEDMVEDIGVFFVAKSPAKFAGLAVLTASLVILCFGIKNFFGNRTVKVFTGLVFASAVIPLIGVYSGYITSTVMANIMLLLYAAIFVWSAYIEEDRRLFWAGILTVSVMIVSRTLEYETGLHIKAAAFTACGIGVMAAGVIFERYLKSRRLCDE